MLHRTQAHHVPVRIAQWIRRAVHPSLKQVDAALHGDQVQLIDLPGDGIGIQLLQVHVRTSRNGEPTYLQG
ncbi:hypothetical protein D3C86_1782250 [compost metagenome]